MPLDLPDVDAICIYGLEDEALFERLLIWLQGKEERSLIVLSSQPLFFPANSRLEAICLASGQEENLLKQCAWNHLFETFHYLPQGNEKESEIFSCLANIKRGVDLVASDYSDLGDKLWKNLFSNLKLRSRAYLGESLFGQYKNIPAIICGAGPSLKPELELLAKLQDRALIFGGGSALPHVSAFAHFGACIDPEHPLRGKFELPFFYQDRVSNEVLQDVHGPLLWISDSGTLPLERFLNEDKAPFDGGWNVATFCLALAYAMGCNPIILAGVDLSSGSTDQLAAVQWLEEFAASHPETSFINCSSYRNYRGMENCTLAKAQEKYLSSMYSFSKLPSLLPAPQVSVEKIKKSLLACEPLVQKMLQVVENIFPETPDGKGEYILAAVELEEELFYQKVIEPLWKIWQPLLKKNDDHPLGQFVNPLLFYQRVIACVHNYLPKN